MTSVRWDRDALLANPAFESLWPVIALCPSHRFPEAGDLSDLARARGAASGGGAAQRLAQAAALDSTRMLAPLPILGVPGWEAANERESFYDDASVFRPGRSG